MPCNDARNIERMVLRALAERGQSDTAIASQITETRLSRWKNDDANGGGLNLPAVASVLSALGLALVETGNSDLITTTREEYQALLVLARLALSHKLEVKP